MSEQNVNGTVAVENSRGGNGFLVLLRHGQTVWSESGQHTGRTNIPLTAVGEQQAADAGRRLREAFPEGFSQGCVFSSPLKRACQTAELAGFADHGVLDGIAEWDYGRAEGRTRQQVSEASGFEWDVWRDGPRSLTPTLEGDWVETLPSGEQVPVHAGAEPRRLAPPRQRLPSGRSREGECRNREARKGLGWRRLRRPARAKR